MVWFGLVWFGLVWFGLQVVCHLLQFPLIFWEFMGNLDDESILFTGAFSQGQVEAVRG